MNKLVLHLSLLSSILKVFGFSVWPIITEPLQEYILLIINRWCMNAYVRASNFFYYLLHTVLMPPYIFGSINAKSTMVFSCGNIILLH